VKAVAVVTSQLPVDVALGCTGSTWLSYRRFEMTAISWLLRLPAGLSVVWCSSCFLSVYLFVSFFFGRFLLSDNEVLTEGTNNSLTD
jgi:uncharacterized membrane protein